MLLKTHWLTIQISELRWLPFSPVLSRNLERTDTQKLRCKMRILHHMHHSQLASLFLLVSFVVLIQAEGESGYQAKFPSIWDDGQNGGRKGEADYRIRAELQLSGSSKSFIIEEWASGILEKFRLDMVDKLGGKRRTFLTFKMTNEAFYYEPFQCKLVNNFDSSLMDKDLADKLQPPEMSSQFIPIGVGALWIHALKLESGHSYPSDEDCNRYGEDPTKPRDQSNILNCFESYTVQSSGGYPYDLIFYFRANKTALGPESLASIVLRGESGQVMRIKILEFDGSIDNSLVELPDLFDLPLGYGCKRSDNMEEALDTPVNILGSDLSGPNVFRLDIVAQLPPMVDNNSSSSSSKLPEQHVDRWRSHSTSVRLVAGRITLGLGEQRDYLILEKRELVPDKRLSGRRATLKRARQVWDLGTGGLDLPVSVPNSPARRKIYYELDDQLEKCLAMGETSQQHESGASVDFFETNFKIGEIELENDDPSGRVKGLMIDLSFLNLMFGQPDGYHQIRKGFSAIRATFNELIFEKRLERFDMRNQHGELIWSGPISLVRRDLQSKKLAWHGGPWGVDLPESSVTIHFLNEATDRLVGKVHLALNERRTINQVSFHRELNVAPCLSSSQGQTDPKNGEEVVEIKINYPIESDSVAESLSNCNHCQTMIQEQFLRALYNVSEGHLNALQVMDINLEVIGSGDMLKVSTKLMPLPKLLNYRRQPEVRFSSARKSLLFSEVQLNDSGCAESCEHYNCSAFAYCSKSQQCDLFMGSKELLSKVGTEQANGCSMYWNKEHSDDYKEFRRAPKPIELLHQIREAIVKTSDTDGGYNPLGLWMFSCEQGKDNKLDQLFPISMETSRDHLDLDNGFEENLGHLLRAEYELVLENRRLVSKQSPALLFPIPQASYMDYQDCRTLCEQTDCKSFSHCQLERTCMISQLHDTERIREHSERDDYCFIYARDSLSKFSPPLRIQVTPNSKPIQVSDRRDCATRCMNAIDFKCKSFYHCYDDQSDNSHDSNSLCYLSKNYPQSSEILQNIPIETTDNNNNNSSNNNNKTICQLYTRSHLVDFDRFYGKSLPMSEQSGQERDEEAGSEETLQIVKRSLNAEACGLECALGNNCQAFQVCRQSHSHIQSGTARTLEPICVLLAKKLNSDDDWLTADKLVANEYCTSFIVSQQSELKQFLIDPNFRIQSAKNADDDDDESSEFGSSNGVRAGNYVSNWLLNVILLLIGLAIGHGLALVWRRRRQAHNS